MLYIVHNVPEITIKSLQKDYIANEENVKYFYLRYHHYKIPGMCSKSSRLNAVVIMSHIRSRIVINVILTTQEFIWIL